MRVFILLSTLLLFNSSILAQFQKTFYNSYELSDSIKLLKVDFGTEATIESWVGSAILIETQVSIESGNNNLFEALKEAGRYDLVEEKVDSTFIISPKLKDRPIIQNQLGEIGEIIVIKILLPDSFVSTDPTLWKKKEE